MAIFVLFHQWFSNCSLRSPRCYIGYLGEGAGGLDGDPEFHSPFSLRAASPALLKLDSDQGIWFM